MWYLPRVQWTAMVALCSLVSVTPFSMLSTMAEAGMMFEDNWTLLETTYATLLQSWWNQVWSMLPHTNNNIIIQNDVMFYDALYNDCHVQCTKHFSINFKFDNLAINSKIRYQSSNHYYNWHVLFMSTKTEFDRNDNNNIAICACP